MSETPAMKKLRRAGRKFAAAQAARDAAKAELDRAILDADRAGGNTRNAIIEAAGVGRPTVYAVLRPKG